MEKKNLRHRKDAAKLMNLKVGEDGFEPPKVLTSRFTVCPIWPLWYSPDEAPTSRGFHDAKLRIKSESCKYFLSFSIKILKQKFQ